MKPRQELIKSSQIRLAVMQQTNSTATAHQAIESVIDECKVCANGTLGEAMLKYYRNASDRAIRSLIKKVGEYK